jgi:glycosyltransferase involved in cell wall biosynthesis
MSLRLCLIGKYFPIQGGVSKDNQWLAYALARAGFHLHIVTNAEEVEPQYRCQPWSPFPALPEDCAGSITVHFTSKAERRHYIPYANPFVTKLAGLATEVIQTYQCDLIYSYYLEPYAMAAYLAAQWTGVPYGIRHAGSDVGSLFQSPELQPAYRQMILAADYIVATPATYRSFLHLGVLQERLAFPAGPCLPPGVFTPTGKKLDVNAYLCWLHEHLELDAYYSPYRQFAQKPFHQDIPTIGIYGKVGEVKGSFDLLQALGRLRQEGVPFQLLALTQGSPSVLGAFCAALTAQGLDETTWLLPFLPHWEIPSFLRVCTAICFLERDFPIPIHTPLIPLEVFSCGTCLILSHEVAEKQTYRDHLQHGSNVFLADPHAHEELATMLRTIIRDPSASQQIGWQGYEDIGRAHEPLATTGQGWQLLFERIYGEIQQRRKDMSLAEMQAMLAHLYTDDHFRALFTLAPERSFEGYALTEQEKQAVLSVDQRLLEYFATSLKMKEQESLRAVYPATFTLEHTLVQRLFNRFYHDYPAKPHEDRFPRITDFGTFLEQVLASDDQAPCYASSVVRYERLHYFYTYQPSEADAFTAINTELPDAQTLDLETIPRLLPDIHREVFAYQMVPLIDALLTHQVPDEHTWKPERCELLFARELHSLTLNVFTLSPETAQLLDLCQEGLTIGTIIARLEQLLGEKGLGEDVLAMLGTLQEHHILGAKL